MVRPPPPSSSSDHGDHQKENRHRLANSSRQSARSRVRPRATCAGGGHSSPSILDRPSWNPSTAIEDSKKKYRQDQQLGQDRDVNLHKLGHLDEEFRFVRGLRLQTMYDPIYRPPPNFIPSESRQPIVNFQIKPQPVLEGGQGHGGDWDSPTKAASLSALKNANLVGEEEAAMLNGPRAVEVLGSVRASLDKSLVESDGDVRRSVVRESMVINRDESKGNIVPSSWEGQRDIMQWMRKIGVKISDDWAPKCETGLHLGKKSHEAIPAKPNDDFLNGVMLCELAAAVEKLNNAAQARGSLRCVEDHEKVRRFVLQGTAMQPKCHAQVSSSK